MLIVAEFINAKFMKKVLEPIYKNKEETGGQ